MGVTRRTGWLSLVAFTLLAATFFLKTTGVHFDAVNYLRVALFEPFGDSAATGKPWLFYGINYALFHGVGPLLGRGQVVAAERIDGYPAAVGTGRDGVRSRRVHAERPLG